MGVAPDRMGTGVEIDEPTVSAGDGWHADEHANERADGWHADECAGYANALPLKV